jgi:hypothetical protein
MYVSNSASRLDIHLNACLRTEISATSLPDGRRPHEEGYRVIGKETYNHFFFYINRNGKYPKKILDFTSIHFEHCGVGTWEL